MRCCGGLLLDGAVHRAAPRGRGPDGPGAARAARCSSSRAPRNARARRRGPSAAGRRARRRARRPRLGLLSETIETWRVGLGRANFLQKDHRAPARAAARRDAARLARPAPDRGLLGGGVRQPHARRGRGARRLCGTISRARCRSSPPAYWGYLHHSRAHDHRSGGRQPRAAARAHELGRRVLRARARGRAAAVGRARVGADGCSPRSARSSRARRPAATRRPRRSSCSAAAPRRPRST